MRIVDKQHPRSGRARLPASQLHRRCRPRPSPAPGWAFPRKPPGRRGAKALAPQTLATLVLMARDIFPHDQFGDGIYVVAAQPWDDKAGADAAFKTLLEGGVARLDSEGP